MLFVPYGVTVFTHMNQQTRSLYVKSQIVHIIELFMFQKYVSNVRETLMQSNIKLIHLIYIYSVKNKNKYKCNMWMMDIF